MSERPDLLSTLVAARTLYEEAHDIWFRAMDKARWSHPIRDETVHAAYAMTGEAITKYARAMSYMEDVIHSERWPAQPPTNRSEP